MEGAAAIHTNGLTKDFGQGHGLFELDHFHSLLAELAAQGRTVFLSSHTLSEVERVAQPVAILRRGRLVVVERRWSTGSTGCSTSRPSTTTPATTRSGTASMPATSRC